MGKKGLKKQPKQPNAANYGDPATAQGITPSLITSITTDQPTSTSQVDSHAPATTRISFFDFITLATTKDIKEFLKLASTTPEGENLGYLWRRAHGEGYEKGRKSLLQDLNKKMEDKFEEGVERGMDLGREEGYTIAKEAFDDIINTVKAREATKKAITTNSGTQTVSTTTITSIATQTSPLTTPTLYDMSPSPLNIATSSKITKNAIITSTVDVSTQTNHLEAKSSTTSDSFAQTNCFNTKKSCQLIHHSNSSRFYCNYGHPDRVRNVPGPRNGLLSLRSHNRVPGAPRKCRKCENWHYKSNYKWNFAKFRLFSIPNVVHHLLRLYSAFHYLRTPRIAFKTCRLCSKSSRNRKITHFHPKSPHFPSS